MSNPPHGEEGHLCPDEVNVAIEFNAGDWATIGRSIQVAVKIAGSKILPLATVGLIKEAAAVMEFIEEATKAHDRIHDALTAVFGINPDSVEEVSEEDMIAFLTKNREAMIRDENRSE